MTASYSLNLHEVPGTTLRAEECPSFIVLRDQDDDPIIVEAAEYRPLAKYLLELADAHDKRNAAN